MAPPSKNFTVIADSAIDADSPITADLMEDFRDNDIYLEEWLGLSYTAAQDHDHDGVNSAPIGISTYNGQLSAQLNGASWSMSTGSLGFSPLVLVAHFSWTTGNTGLIHAGWGLAVGTGAGDQCGMEMDWAKATLHWGTQSIDSNQIVGFTTGAAALYTSFGTEQAAVTAFASSGVTITTQSGAWSASAPDYIYANLQIWGL